MVLAAFTSRGRGLAAAEILGPESLPVHTTRSHLRVSHTHRVITEVQQCYVSGQQGHHRILALFRGRGRDLFCLRSRSGEESHLSVP